MQLLIPKWFRLDNKTFCVRYAISKELTHYLFLFCCTEVVLPNWAHFGLIQRLAHLSIASVNFNCNHMEGSCKSRL